MVNASDTATAALEELSVIGRPYGTGLAACSLHGRRLQVSQAGGRGEAGGPATFDLGSVAKALTALVLLRLARQGRLDLASTVADSAGIPRLPKRWAAITLADLACHRARLPNLPPNVSGPLWDPYRGFDEAQLVRAMARIEEPEAFAGYSNFGYAVLRRCLEQSTGTDLDTLVRDVVHPHLGPSTLRFSPTPVPGLRQGHEASGTPSDHWAFRAMLGAAGLYGTVEDLLTIGEAVIDDRNPLHSALWYARAGGSGPGDSPGDCRGDDPGDSPSIAWGWVSQRLPRSRVSWILGETSVSTALLIIHHEWRVCVAYCVDRGGTDGLLPAGFRCLSRLVHLSTSLGRVSGS